MNHFESKEYDVYYIEPNLFDVTIINVWFIQPKSKYKKFVNFINNFKFKNDWFEAYTWCDISSYEYWKKENFNSYDGNYVVLTIKHEVITEKRKVILEKFIKDTETKFNKKYVTLKYEE